MVECNFKTEQKSVIEERFLRKAKIKMEICCRLKPTALDGYMYDREYSLCDGDYCIFQQLLNVKKDDAPK